ncbi:restriction endonuclease [Candidatus Gracilibacteria bacterium]|nr:restriction endonuclease [Candidatus Gracilibacteria bacterium]MCF7819639.1 restriction endonuclease [Candidatus Gracilibacteria bacterium]
MEDYIWILGIIGIIIIWTIISWIRETISNSKKYLELKPKLDNLERAIAEHESKIQKDKADIEANSKKRLDDYSQTVKSQKDEFDLRKKLWNEKIQNDKEEIDKIAKQKSMGFPWLAEAYADYFALKDGELEKYLREKKHPAYTAAENVRMIKGEKKQLLKENKIVRYKINYFEKLFPWLSELIADDEDEYIPVKIGDDENENNEDRVKDFLTPEEYQSLPTVERNQMALDRYLRNRNKSKWAIGRDYEMYVGHLYEKAGYDIEYKGILDGFEDLGRDVIAKKSGEVCIIQCKNWAQYKVIHEKHIFQLFGTTMEYWLNNYQSVRNEWNLFAQNIRNGSPQKSFEEFAKFLNEEKLKPIFFTSTSLSDKAKEMANALSVEIRENEAPGEFPRIKCNINSDEFGRQTKIYHLPMDQQYDRTIIGNRSGEFYAFTVKEAEDAGFRRAFKHRY